MRPFLFVIFLAFAVPAWADPNREIYDFCLRHQGQQVGDGICQSLVDAAFHSAGLPVGRGLGREIWRISSTSRGVVVSGDYRKVRPGDIVYLHDIMADRSKHRSVPDAGRTPNSPRENHVGVVESLTLDGVRYFNQNAGHQKQVRVDDFPFSQGLDVVDYVAVFRP